MAQNSLSTTYKKLFHSIVASHIALILKNFPAYCLKSPQVPYDIGRKYEEYKSMADKCIKSPKLDRHKLASCVCGAIIAIQPIRHKYDNSIVNGANETFALYTGLAVMKQFMMYDILDKQLTFAERQNVRNYLPSHFDILWPTLDDNICDVPEYEQNLRNALYWASKQYGIPHKEPFQYDVLAYATIFFHLELYNKPRLDRVYEEYRKSNNLSA